jgi:hypothetical protein
VAVSDIMWIFLSNTLLTSPILAKHSLKLNPLYVKKISYKHHYFKFVTVVLFTVLLSSNKKNTE